MAETQADARGIQTSTPAGASNSDRHAASVAYLTSLLNKQLLITTKDSRKFLGSLKCSDRDRNLILQSTYEYRPPTAAALAAAQADAEAAGSADAERVRVDMTSRFLGLVTIPGEQIVSIMLQEFASQARG